ncbi:hypothetical protein BT93_H1932 [Corymbia citriodora subsp. variegata]|nr:hypothetical protein BT93_H1932 [Corymbia citriodora subsp. variegata]
MWMRSMYLAYRCAAGDRALSLCFLRHLKRQNHRAMKKLQEDGKAPGKIA